MNDKYFTTDSYLANFHGNCDFRIQNLIDRMKNRSKIYGTEIDSQIYIQMDRLMDKLLDRLMDKLLDRLKDRLMERLIDSLMDR